MVNVIYGSFVCSANIWGGSLVSYVCSTDHLNSQQVQRTAGTAFFGNVRQFTDNHITELVWKTALIERRTFIRTEGNAIHRTTSRCRCLRPSTGTGMYTCTHRMHRWWSSPYSGIVSLSVSTVHGPVVVTMVVHCTSECPRYIEKESVATTFVRQSAVGALVEVVAVRRVVVHLGTQGETQTREDVESATCRPSCSGHSPDGWAAGGGKLLLRLKPIFLGLPRTRTRRRRSCCWLWLRLAMPSSNTTNIKARMITAPRRRSCELVEGFWPTDWLSMRFLVPFVCLNTYCTCPDGVLMEVRPFTIFTRQIRLGRARKKVAQRIRTCLSIRRSSLHVWMYWGYATYSFRNSFVPTATSFM